MTTPSDPENAQFPREGVDLGKSAPPPYAEPGASKDPGGEAPFDPYRFGKPDHPIPAEYAPPGYTGPVAPARQPYGGPPNPYAPPPAGAGQDNPFANPPGTPYGAAHGGQPPYQYPPQGYVPGAPGAPLPPPYHGYAQPTGSNGKAIAALVLGILSIVFCWLSVFDGIFVVLALIFGLIALSETKGNRRTGRGLAVAGLVCMIVGALLATIISVKVFSAIDKCGGLNQSDRSTFNQCIRDNL
jgi:uncharacterized protein DUF4190